MHDVEILLSTYNGEKYLPQQLKSIENQQVINWALITRDDGSVDSSPEILKNFEKKHPGRIQILDDSEERLGICESYSRLMAATTSNYIMFCDQDDVWLPEKIKKTLYRMKQLEGEKGADRPLLVHCDLIVASEALSLQHDSFWAFQGINPKHANRFNRQLVMNTVTGCAMMINRKLLEMAMPIPSDALIHDWWIAQTASAFGESVYVPEALILYRQHGDNSIGAQKNTTFNLIKMMWKNLTDEYERQRMLFLTDGQLKQARAFFKRFEHLLSGKQKKIIRDYLKLFQTAPFLRFGIMARSGLWKFGFLRNLALGFGFGQLVNLIAKLRE